MVDPTPDDEAETSAFVSVLRHDHSEPGGYAPELEGGVVRISVDPRPAGSDPEDPEMGPVVVVQFWLEGNDHNVMAMLDAAAALELADRIAAAARKALGD